MFELVISGMVGNKGPGHTREWPVNIEAVRTPMSSCSGGHSYTIATRVPRMIGRGGGRVIVHCSLARVASRFAQAYSYEGIPFIKSTIEPIVAPLYDEQNTVEVYLPLNPQRSVRKRALRSSKKDSEMKHWHPI